MKKKMDFQFQKVKPCFSKRKFQLLRATVQILFLLSSKSCSKNVNVFKIVTTKIPPISNKKKEIKDFSDETKHPISRRQLYIFEKSLRIHGWIGRRTFF